MFKRFIQDSDSALLKQLAAGQKHAFDALVKRHAQQAYRIAFRFLNQQHDAEDMVQDAFLKLWKNPEMWKEDSNAKFSTWFYRIIANQCLDVIRARKPQNPDALDVQEDTSALQDDALQEKRQHILVEQALKTLPEHYQMALNLSFYEGIPNQQAAEIMQLSLKAFQSMLMRAKQALKDEVLKTNPPQKEQRYG